MVVDAAEPVFAHHVLQPGAGGAFQLNGNALSQHCTTLEEARRF